MTLALCSEPKCVSPIKFQTRAGNRFMKRVLMCIPDDGKEDTKKATSRKTLLWCWFSRVRCPVL